MSELTDEEYRAKLNSYPEADWELMMKLFEKETGITSEDVLEMIATVRAEQKERDARICDTVAGELDGMNGPNSGISGDDARDCAQRIREQKP